MNKSKILGAVAIAIFSALAASIGTYWATRASERRPALSAGYQRVTARLAPQTTAWFSGFDKILSDADARSIVTPVKSEPIAWEKVLSEGEGTAEDKLKKAVGRIESALADQQSAARDRAFEFLTTLRSKFREDWEATNSVRSGEADYTIIAVRNNGDSKASNVRATVPNSGLVQLIVTGKSTALTGNVVVIGDLQPGEDASIRVWGPLYTGNIAVRSDEMSGVVEDLDRTPTPPVYSDPRFLTLALSFVVLLLGLAAVEMSRLYKAHNALVDKHNTLVEGHNALVAKNGEADAKKKRKKQDPPPTA